MVFLARIGVGCEREVLCALCRLRVAVFGLAKGFTVLLNRLGRFRWDRSRWSGLLATLLAGGLEPTPLFRPPVRIAPGAHRIYSLGSVPARAAFLAQPTRTSLCYFQLSFGLMRRLGIALILNGRI